MMVLQPGPSKRLREMTWRAALLMTHLALPWTRQRAALLMRHLALHQRHLAQPWSNRSCHRLLGMALIRAQADLPEQCTPLQHEVSLSSCILQAACCLSAVDDVCKLTLCTV